MAAPAQHGARRHRGAVASGIQGEPATARAVLVGFVVAAVSHALRRVLLAAAHHRAAVGAGHGSGSPRCSSRPSSPTPLPGSWWPDASGAGRDGSAASGHHGHRRGYHPTSISWPSSLDTDLHPTSPRSPGSSAGGRARGSSATRRWSPTSFGQEIVCTHDGRPFLRWESRTWLLDDDGEQIRQASHRARLLAAGRARRRRGQRRAAPRPPDRHRRDVCRHGRACEGRAGHRRGHAQPPRQGVCRGHRMYGYVQSNLMWVMDMAAMGAQLSRTSRRSSSGSSDGAHRGSGRPLTRVGGQGT